MPAWYDQFKFKIYLFHMPLLMFASGYVYFHTGAHERPLSKLSGYGGSCFPKDVRALLHTVQEHDSTLGVVAAVDAANEAQKRRLLEKIWSRFGRDLQGKRFALWGLAFKPNTDAMRSALRTPALFDGRNLYKPSLVRRHGIEYFGIGRP